MGDQPDSPFEGATPLIPPLKGARGMFKLVLQGMGKRSNIFTKLFKSPPWGVWGSKLRENVRCGENYSPFEGGQGDVKI